MLLVQKLKEQGISDATVEDDSIQHAVKRILAGEQSFTVDDGRVGALVSVELSDADLRRMATALEQTVDELVPDLAERFARLSLRRVKRSAREGLDSHRAERQFFQARLRSRWGKAFDGLALEIALATEAGDEIGRLRYSRRRIKNPHLNESLTRLHARACQTAGEVLALLESGYADGALARWRTLHEISVVASFLGKTGETSAERYLLHEDIESLRAAELYNRFAATTHSKPITKREIGVLKRNADRLIRRFGAPFGKDYGWAENVIKGRPTFADIEAAIGLDHARPHYKLASGIVHAGPKAMIFKLGLLAGSESIVLAGPSNAGLDEAGRLTAHSLGQVTTDLLLSRPTLDCIVWSKVMLAVSTETGSLFTKAQRRLELDAK